MKINNPTKFFSEVPSSEFYAERKNNATLISRGDIIKKFASEDSQYEIDWHMEELSGDAWMKISFDAGTSYPLKFKYKNNLILKKYIAEPPVANTASIFSFEGDEYASSKNGKVSLYAINEDKEITTLPFFRYKFDDSAETLSITPLMAIPNDSTDTMVIIELNPDSIMGLSVPSFIDVSYIDITGIDLDSNNSSSEIPGNFENISKMYIKISAADNKSGNVVLKFTFGESNIITQTISVDGEDTWKEIYLNGQKSGSLVIERLCDNEADTLKEDGAVITCTISNIKVVMYS